MCNCGNKRKEFTQQTGSANTQRSAPAPTLRPYAGFEYVGKTALTITGNVTGAQYRFNSPGSRQNIDYRDMPGVMSIPVLRKIQ